MEKSLTRRSFLGGVMADAAISLSAAGLCVCLLSGCMKKDSTPAISDKWLEFKDNRLIVEVDNVPSLLRVGGAAKIVHAKLPERLIIVHPVEARFVALSGLCTHQGRALEYRHDQRQLRCINCGHSLFGLDGKPISGPAKKELKVYKTLFLGGKLEIFV